MSVWQDDMDAIITLVRAATTLPSGALGAEKDYRRGNDLDTDELPHLLLFNPLSTDEVLEHKQVRVLTVYQAELWDDATQATMSTVRDAIRDGVDADPTLGGTVLGFRMLSSGLFEDTSAEDRKVLVIEFETERLET